MPCATIRVVSPAPPTPPAPEWQKYAIIAGAAGIPILIALAAKGKREQER